MQPTATRDPFLCLLQDFEKKLTPEFKSKSWPTLRHAIALHVTRVKNRGKFILGFADTQIPANIASEVEQLFFKIDHNPYFTNELWRAFCWYASKGTIHPRWSSFGYGDANLLMSVLDAKEVSKVKEHIDRIMVDWTCGPSMNKVMKTIRPYIHHVCRKRLHFLFDPIYAFDDIVQEIYYQVFRRLVHSNSKIDCEKTMLIWAMRCVNNAVSSIIRFALAKQRNWMIPKTQSTDPMIQPTVQSRTIELSDVADLVSGTLGPGQEILIEELKCLAPQKIEKYISLVMEEQPSPEFDEWRNQNKKIRHGTMESRLGRDAQEWLELSTKTIVSFLQQEVPELLRQHRFVAA